MVGTQSTQSTLTSKSRPLISHDILERCAWRLTTLRDTVKTRSQSVGNTSGSVFSILSISVVHRKSFRQSPHVTSRWFNADEVDSCKSASKHRHLPTPQLSERSSSYSPSSSPEDDPEDSDYTESWDIFDDGGMKKIGINPPKDPPMERWQPGQYPVDKAMGFMFTDKGMTKYRVRWAETGCCEWVWADDCRCGRLIHEMFQCFCVDMKEGTRWLCYRRGREGQFVERLAGHGTRARQIEFVRPDPVSPSAPLAKGEEVRWMETRPRDCASERPVPTFTNIAARRINRGASVEERKDLSGPQPLGEPTRRRESTTLDEAESSADEQPRGPAGSIDLDNPAETHDPERLLNNSAQKESSLSSAKSKVSVEIPFNDKLRKLASHYNSPRQGIHDFEKGRWIDGTLHFVCVAYHVKPDSPNFPVWTSHKEFSYKPSGERIKTCEKHRRMRFASLARCRRKVKYTDRDISAARHKSIGGKLHFICTHYHRSRSSPNWPE